MKILIINYKYYIAAGTERYMFNIADTLVQNGHQVIPFSLKSSKNEPTPYAPYFAESVGGQDEFLYENYKMTPSLVIDAIARLFYSPHVKYRLEKLIQDTKPDLAYIIHHYNKMSPSVIDACKKFDLPVVQRLSDFFLLCPQAHFLRNGKICEDCLVSGYHNAARYRCIKSSFSASLLKALAISFQRRILKVYDRVDKYVCTTSFMRQKMIQGGFAPSRLEVIPTYIPDQMIRAQSTEKALGRHILFFGRFAEEKGIDLLIRAFAESGLYQQGLRLVLIGGSPSFLRRFVFTSKELEVLDNHVDILDFLPFAALEPYLETCLFVVNPTHWYENLPNTILESYAKLKPVISADIGSIPEIVFDQQTGLLYRYDDKNDLSDKMKLLYADPKLRGQMKANIKKLLAQMNRDQHYARLIQVFADLVK